MASMIIGTLSRARKIANVVMKAGITDISPEPVSRLFPNVSEDVTQSVNSTLRALRTVRTRNNNLSTSSPGLNVQYRSVCRQVE